MPACGVLTFSVIEQLLRTHPVDCLDNALPPMSIRRQVKIPFERQDRRRVFTSHSCLVERVTLAGEGVLDIDVPASAITEDGTIVLSVLVDDLMAPAAIGLNGDARALEPG